MKILNSSFVDACTGCLVLTRKQAYVVEKLNEMHNRQTSTFRSSLNKDSEGLVIVRNIRERWQSKSKAIITSKSKKCNTQNR